VNDSLEGQIIVDLEINDSLNKLEVNNFKSHSFNHLIISLFIYSFNYKFLI
jgi:hypothetical protein